VDHKSELPSAGDFTRIEGELFARIDARYRRQVVRHRLVAVAAILVVAGAGVAAGTIVNPTQQSHFAYCYDGSTTSARNVQLALTFEAKPGANPAAGISEAQAANAKQICAAAWSGGIFSSSSGSGPFAVPALQACVRDDLTVSVFRKPNSETARGFCDNLGLSVP
jgi:hypothetical protein